MRDLKDFGAILFIIVLVVAALQWGLLRFTHWSVALISTGIIGLFISGIYVSLKHARPNGGNRSIPDSAYIAPAIIILTSLLLGMWLVSYASKIHLPKLAILIPIGLMFIFAISSNIYEQINSATFYFKNFNNCEIEIIDNSEGKSSVDEIAFQNSVSGFNSNIIIKPYISSNPSMIRFIDTITVYYSSKNTQRTKKDFPFDYNLFKEEKGPTVGYFFWIKSHKILPLKLVLLPDDKVDLYINNRFTAQYP